MQVNASTYSFGKINFHLSSALFGLVGMCGHIPNVHLVLLPACGESVAFKEHSDFNLELFNPPIYCLVPHFSGITLGYYSVDLFWCDFLVCA